MLQKLEFIMIAPSGVYQFAFGDEAGDLGFSFE